MDYWLCIYSSLNVCTYPRYCTARKTVNIFWLVCILLHVEAEFLQNHTAPAKNRKYRFIPKYEMNSENFFATDFFLLDVLLGFLYFSLVSHFSFLVLKILPSWWPTLRGFIAKFFLQTSGNQPNFGDEGGVKVAGTGHCWWRRKKVIRRWTSSRRRIKKIGFRNRPELLGRSSDDRRLNQVRIWRR